jgi:hypothetical protein
MFKAIRAVASSFLLLVAGLLFSVCADAQQAPKELQLPSGERLVLRLHGKGDQIYTCTEQRAQFAWLLKAPEAQLTDKDGKPFGKHFAGPSWEANDGSRITGKAVANAPSPDADSIPWLLITVMSHSGEGVLARVSSVQRVNTKGGKASASGCDAAHAGQEERKPYSAEYLFFAPQ